MAYIGKVTPINILFFTHLPSFDWSNKTGATDGKLDGYVLEEHSF